MAKRTQASHSQDTTADGEPTAAAQARNLMCWGCGSHPGHLGDRLCLNCSRQGVDPHWIPCTWPEHTHVARRTWRGQQSFTCRNTDPLPLDY